MSILSRNLLSNDSNWSSKTFLPYYIGFIRWVFYIILKLIPCIFYMQYTTKYVNNKKEKLSPDKFEEPVYTTKDITVVIPVYQPPICFKKNIISIAKNNPYEIIIVADITCYKNILEQIKEIGTLKCYVTIYPESRPGKRPAMESGLKKTSTKLICYTDDDVQWCENFLFNLIIPFNFKNIGGVGSKQIMRSAEIVRLPNFYEIMADMRLSVRYVENKAMAVVDKGTSCISGRTACYKTDIIQNEDFYHKFLNEYFFDMKLASGDDKFLTRYVLNNGYDTYHQLDTNCTLTTTFESGLMHFKQSLRWSRNTNRSDFTLLFIEKKIWRLHPYTALILFDKMFTPLYILYGLVVIPVFSILRKDYYIFVGWLIWLLVSRGVKLIGHFVRKPKHIFYLPIFIFYQYLLVILRIYAIFTIYDRSWGNRAVTIVNNEIVRTGSHANLEEASSDLENVILDDSDAENGYEADIENKFADKPNKKSTVIEPPKYRSKSFERQSYTLK